MFEIYFPSVSEEKIFYQPTGPLDTVGEEETKILKLTQSLILGIVFTTV